MFTPFIQPEHLVVLVLVYQSLLFNSNFVSQWVATVTHHVVVFISSLSSDTAAGEAQDHGQHGGAAAAVRGGGPGLWRPAGGLHAAVPVPAAAVQRHERAGDATQTADKGKNKEETSK